MTYGLKVLNGDGRTIINSDEGYPNTQLSLDPNITSTEASRTNFTANSNLVFTRPNTTTGGPFGAAISKSILYSGTTYLLDHWMTNYSNFTYPSTTYKVATLSNQSSPATPSEYGLQVIADDQSSTTLLMTEGFDNSFDILYTGEANASTTTFANINWQTDSNIYVLINNTNHSYANLSGAEYEGFTGYVFESNGTLTYRQEFHVGNTTSFFNEISGNDYLIVRVKS
jgi:hypothetical protein